MSKRDNDNIFKIGATVSAKGDPSVNLVIKKYIHHFYFCNAADDDSRNYRRYLEKDLVARDPLDLAQPRMTLKLS
jgi:hypothetical protein